MKTMAIHGLLSNKSATRGIVVMGSVEKLTKPGHYLAMFHDDGRFFKREGKRANPTVFTLLQTFPRTAV